MCFIIICIAFLYQMFQNTHEVTLILTIQQNQQQAIPLDLLAWKCLIGWMVRHERQMTIFESNSRCKWYIVIIFKLQAPAPKAQEFFFKSKFLSKI